MKVNNMMPHIKKRILPLLILCMIFITCQGCISENMESLFRLPQPSEEFIELQRKIDEVLASGATYLSPSSGTYRQSVQLYDINGDGMNEAIAFFNTTGEKPLRIYIFEKNGSNYETRAVIEGSGAGIESIYYTDMNNDGWSEIVVGWKMEAGIQMLKLYSLKGFQPAVIATSDYTAYTVADPDSDDCDELIVVRHNSNEQTGIVDILDISADGETESVSAMLSPGMLNVSKLTVALLGDRRPAVFIEGGFGGSGMITDVFIYEDRRVRNISADETGVSRCFERKYTVSCRDIDGDGVMEIPMPLVLSSKTDTTVYRALDWYTLSSDGTMSLALTTYHNYSDSWYLILPYSWRDILSLRRDDTIAGERAVVFSVWNGPDEPVTDFMVVYTLTGENRNERAQRDGKEIIRVDDEVIYAAKLLIKESDWKNMVNMQYVKQNFSLIYSEWYTGFTG